MYTLLLSAFTQSLCGLHQLNCFFIQGPHAESLLGIISFSNDLVIYKNLFSIIPCHHCILELITQSHVFYSSNIGFLCVFFFKCLFKVTFQFFAS